MNIGIPKERKSGERRVALTPIGAAELVGLGHSIFIEKDAGALSGFPDAEYVTAGATICNELSQVWERAELLVKVKEPAPEEFTLFRPGLAVFSFLHPAVAPDLVKALLEKNVIGLDYDLVMLEDMRLPILEPMSVVAGKLAIQCGAYALQANGGGRGVLLGGTPGVTSGKVVVIGAGAAGANAARVAIGMGARVTVIDINPDKLAPFAAPPYNANTVISSPQAIENEVRDADLVIGSVLIPGALAPKLLTRAMLKKMRRGAVIVDICIDQGGFAETSRATSIADPTYIEEGIVHYCVPNMPSLVPQTSTLALTNATMRWIKLLAGQGIKQSVQTVGPIRKSLVSVGGKLTNAAIGEALHLPWITPDAAEKLL